jgi:hypothetical protein
MRFDTYEDSYDNPPHMVCRIVDRNQGSYYDVLHFPNPRVALTSFKWFFCLGAYMRAFQFYLPVICIDDTFLIENIKVKHSQESV